MVLCERSFVANNKAKKAPSACTLEEERRAKAAAELRAQEERAAQLAAEQEAARRAEREAAELAGAAERAALREDAELAEALRRSEVDAEEALARRVSRCEEAVSSESTGGGGDLPQRVERLEASLGAATEGSLEERVGAIERLIGPEAREAAEQHLPVTEPSAAVSLADAGLDTGRQAAPESTMGGETSCIICFERPKSHLAVPCSHLCVCGPCSELMRECPYCREPWVWDHSQDTLEGWDVERHRWQCHPGVVGRSPVMRESPSASKQKMAKSPRVKPENTWVFLPGIFGYYPHWTLEAVVGHCQAFLIVVQPA
ncbi:hypothetical protein EMIHUDRAFT_229099 [Emiliania huxleyi CCMP1516]|uniref:RING-type domain-containing protein n=2 Tax=Emiliania huxleyi TaxID=2903 RepID=A0A0D3KDI5_EMIH1|nr:hypothetical protein EMIHUDRAFT_229099 [Emiliania huxleyi CCMP1516]EOD33820.1 hypothetical protein EMIHUDRAFT_229099 [Emiliania huxleyi CCMP1516]|eukprot:XP_005786249.1 hypothetical protein EMIHUDRAFT_229099 [Emiliania huxleyi CCMP1516]